MKIGLKGSLDWVRRLITPVTLFAVSQNILEFVRQKHIWNFLVTHALLLRAK